LETGRINSHNIMTLQYMPDKSGVKSRGSHSRLRQTGRDFKLLQWRRWLEDMAFPHYDPQTFAYVRTRIDNDPRLSREFIKLHAAGAGHYHGKRRDQRRG